MWRFALSITVTLALVGLGPDSARAQGRVSAIHNATDQAYQEWVDGLGKNYRPVFVQVVTIGETTRFCAVATQSLDGTPWIARHDLGVDAFQAEFDKNVAEGYRLISVAPYTRGNRLLAAGIWVKEAKAPRWLARTNLSPEQYQTAFDKMVKDGFRPIQIAGCRSEGGHRLAAIFVADQQSSWVARHDLTVEGYQKVFDEYTPKGFRPLSVNAYGTAAGTRFAVVMVQDKAVNWEAAHDLTAVQFQARFDDWTGAGLTPIAICGYPWQGDIRFLGAFLKIDRALPAGPLPVSGVAVPELAAYDQAMQKFMHERGIQTGTLAVSRRGKIVLERGYGWLDAERTHLCGPQTPMRIASISKPFTLAALRKLLQSGKIDLKTRAFVYLDVQAPAGRTMDRRLLDITIQDLIDHKGGWDRDKAGDPMFMSQKIAKALGKTGPPSPSDIITYMAGQPLQFDPGKKSVYSNFGYCVLGRVIEKASGKKYLNYLKESVTQPLGLKSIQIARTLPKFRNAAEPVYLDPGSGINIMEPGSKRTVAVPDGNFCVETMDSHGGLLCSAPDLVRFLQAYWINGEPRKAGESASYTFFGSLPGTSTMAHQRADGVNIVVLFNQRTDPSGLSYDDIEGVMDRVTNGIKRWPN